jgi:hypothetical protein
VRVEIAGRAHRGKFTPKLGISLQGIKVKNRMGILEKICKKVAIERRGSKTLDARSSRFRVRLWVRRGKLMRHPNA